LAGTGLLTPMFAGLMVKTAGPYDVRLMISRA
jgi:hypothetical protein